MLVTVWMEMVVKEDAAIVDDVSNYEQSLL